MAETKVNQRNVDGKALFRNSSGGLSLNSTASQAIIVTSTLGAYITWQYNGTSIGDIGTGNQVISGGLNNDFGISSRGGSVLVGINANEVARFTGLGLVIGANALNPSAIVEFASTNKGLLLPRMTTVQRDTIESPANGLMIYNTTVNKFQGRAGGTWVDLH